MDPVKYVRSFMKRTGETVTANRDILLGVKLQVGSNMNGRYSYDFLKIARELCDTYRIPLMTHISFAPPGNRSSYGVDETGRRDHPLL